MRAYAICNSHGPKDDPSYAGGQYGDIIEIYPITANDADMGTETLKHFFPLIIDIPIPCGDLVGPLNDAAGTFTIGPRGPEFKCSLCKYNDPDLCDRIKYLKPEWGAGDIENPPKIIRKRMYQIDLDSVLPIGRPTEEAEIWAWVKDNEQPANVILPKTPIGA